jgi:integrase
MAANPQKARLIGLCWYCKTPQGWRYFPVRLQKRHGVVEVQHGFVNDKGEVKEYPQGRYVLRSYSDGRKVYTPLETCNPRDAVLALNRARRDAAEHAGPRYRLHLLRSAADAYIEDAKKRKAFEAARQARVVLDEFIPLCAPITNTRALTREHIFRFHKALKAKGNSARTIANKHERLKAFFRFCKMDTAFMPPVPKYEKALPTIYSPDEIRAIREAADPYMRVVIDMALKLGLREQELTFAEWDDLDHHHSTFRVQGKVRDGWNFAVKDSEQRDVPIPADLLASLKAWHEKRKNTVLIIGNDEQKPEGHLLRRLKQLARRSDLNCGRCQGCQRKIPSEQECEQWTLHKFRRTCITTWLRNGIDLATVRAWAGHSDMASTLRYLRPASAPEMQSKVNAIVWE